MKLSDRERQILIAYAWGFTPSQIAAIFMVQVSTVRNHLANVLSQLGTHSITHAFVLASYYGLLEHDEDVIRLIEDFRARRDIRRD
jgi:DNA-binding NarL/FixJ family response regulator